MAASVKAEFLHAWRNYERYAWGHDALRPLSKAPHDWYGQSLLMTPVDALDTLILMNLDTEAAKTKELIVRDLSFDRDIYVKNFEITIRLLGGLLSSYQLTNDKRLLQLAEDFGGPIASSVQFANRTALHVCQPAHGSGARSSNEPGGNGHTAA
jgi:mannosidase alpha-like ER degradation enhancer 2